MSLRRFAVVAPLSIYNQNSQPNRTTTTATTEPSIAWLQQQANIIISGGRQPIPSTTFSTNDNFNYDDSNESDHDDVEGSETGANSIVTYYSNIGSGYPNTRLHNVGAYGVPGSRGGSIGVTGDHNHLNAINGNVNLLLGGAMLSLMTTVLCIVCYCCHRSIKKRTEAAYRQQRQWLENDPNMEIYSVEQCYETSGLFLGDSVDGFGALNALHHEPPPSYDAVIAMQEHQILHQHLLQQQLYLQNHSPPPGYRSTLTVCDLSAPAETIAVAGPSPPPPTQTPAIFSAGMRSLSSGDSSCSIASSPTVLPLGGKQMNALSTSTATGGIASVTILNMKKVLSAQSCCSLQRAEVESMWNAADAAVAVSTAHGGLPATPASDGDTNSCCSERTETSRNVRQSTPPSTRTRKSLPLTLAARFATINRVTRPLAAQHGSGATYRRGCPLCGKFRNDADETLTVSRESGLDNPATFDVNANANSNNGSKTFASISHQEAATSSGAAQQDDAPASESGINRGDECSCLGIVNSVDPVYIGIAGTSYPNFIDADNNNTSGTELDHDHPSEPIPAAADDENSNRSGPPTITDSSAAALDTINANSGVIRVDMSKVIDPSGLPTYEAALKLESSGYV